MAIEPITRREMFMAKAGGQDINTPTPITREEMFLSQIGGFGGGAYVVATFEGGLTDNVLTCTADMTFEEVWIAAKAEKPLRLHFYAPTLGLDFYPDFVAQNIRNGGRVLVAYIMALDPVILAIWYKFTEDGVFSYGSKNYNGEETTEATGTVTWAAE